MSITTGTPTEQTITTAAGVGSTTVVVPAGCSHLDIVVFGPSSGTFSLALDSVSVGAAVVERTDDDARKVSRFIVAAPDEGVLTLDLSTSFDAISYFIVATPVLGAASTRTTASATSYTTTPTVTLTTEADDLVIDAVYGGGTLTAGAGQTQLSNLGSGPYRGVSSEIASGTSTTMSWTMSFDRWVTAAVAYVPAEEPSGPNPAAERAQSYPGYPFRY